MKVIFRVIVIIFCLTAPSLFISGNNLIFDKALIGLSNSKILVELADTAVKRNFGLMFRKALNKNSGMLFIFEDSEVLSFWMKNTLIPLDIAFFDKDKRLFEVLTMEPYSKKLFYSSKEARYALEMNKGWFKRNNISIGSRFIILKKFVKK